MDGRLRVGVTWSIRKAGLSLTADLNTLDSSHRISANPSALAYVVKYVTFSGDLTKPQLNIHTTGDRLVPVEGEQACGRLT
jgi:hypothetical protein